jgi:DNA-binding CsgD family transcriptional regulator
LGGGKQIHGSSVGGAFEEIRVARSGHRGGMTMVVCDRLSEGQKACLRLVLAHHEIKEIARELGVAPDTVKQRLQAARRLLGVSRSIDAARLLADHEAQDAYPSRVYPPRDVPDPVDPMPSGLVDRKGEPFLATTEHRVGERLVAYEPPASPLRRSFGWPFPTTGRTINDLTTFAIIVWVCVGAIVLGLVALGLTMVGITAQDELTRLL